MEKLDEKEFISKLHAICEKLNIDKFKFDDKLNCYRFDICDEEETYLFECQYDPEDSAWSAVFHEDSYDFSAADLRSLLIKVDIFVLEGASKCGCSSFKYEGGKWKLFIQYMKEMLGLDI